MSTLAEEVTAQVLDQRERAMALNAVKLALANLQMLRDSGAIGDFAHPGAGLRLNDLESVVEQAQRVAEVDSFNAVDRVYTNELTRLRADLAKVVAQRDELVSGVEKLTATCNELTAEVTHLRRECVATGDAGEKAVEIAKAIKAQRAETAAERDVLKARLDAAEQLVSDQLEVLHELKAERDGLLAKVTNPWRVVQCELASGEKIPQHNVVRNFAPPYEHHGKGGFTKQEAEEIAGRLNGGVIHALPPDQMLIRKDDYERLIKSLPAGPRAVK